MSEEFPAHLFKLDGSPGEIQGSANQYKSFGKAATEASQQITAMDTSSFRGDEGDLFREKVNSSLPPNLNITGEAFTGVGNALAAFATELSQLQSQMRPLASQAPGLWEALQNAKGRLANAQQADQKHEQKLQEQQLQPSSGPPKPAEPYNSGTPEASGAVNAAQAAWDNCVRKANGIRADMESAVETCGRVIDTNKDKRFKEPPGTFDVIGKAEDFISEHKDVLQKISGVLKVVSGVCAAIGLALQAIPVIGNAVGGAFLAVAGATGAAALVIDVAVYAATGEGSLTNILIDTALTVIPFGRIASLGKKGFTALKSADEAADAGKAAASGAKSAKNADNAGQAGSQGAKNADNAGNGTKNADNAANGGKNADEAGNAGKQADETAESGKNAGEAGKGADDAAESTKSADNAANTGKSADGAANAGKSADDAAEGAGDVAKASDEAADGAKNADEAGNTGKNADNADDAAKSARGADDAADGAKNTDGVVNAGKGADDAAHSADEAADAAKSGDEAGEAGKNADEAADDAATGADDVAHGADDAAAHADSPNFETTNMLWKYRGEHLPGNSVFNTPVKYLDDVQRQDYKISVDENGLLRDSRGELLDTSTGTSVHSADPRAIFVMDKHGEIYVSNYQEVGRFHHSSFLGGQPVAAAGEMKVEQGILKLVSNNSGHYRPGKETLRNFAEHLFKTRGAKLDPDAEMHAIDR